MGISLLLLFSSSNKEESVLNGLKMLKNNQFVRRSSLVSSVSQHYLNCELKLDGGKATPQRIVCLSSSQPGTGAWCWLIKLVLLSGITVLSHHLEDHPSSQYSHSSGPVQEQRWNFTHACKPVPTIRMLSLCLTPPSRSTHQLNGLYGFGNIACHRLSNPLI